MTRALSVVAATILVSSAADAQQSFGPESALNDLVAYMCPIHSDYTADGPGICPRDGMMLVP